MSPLQLDGDRWAFAEPTTPTEQFGDALLWHDLAERYPGWWTAGAQVKADDLMRAALAGAGVPC